MLPVTNYTHFDSEPCFNMAFDSRMLTFVRLNPGMVLLRLYTWAIPTITIGLNQITERAVDMRQLGRTPLIRRVTGGRAVFHDCSELTYAIAANTEGVGSHPLKQTVSAVHRAIAGLPDPFRFPPRATERGSGLARHGAGAAPVTEGQDGQDAKGRLLDGHDDLLPHAAVHMHAEKFAFFM